MALIVLGELLPETALSSYRAYHNQKRESAFCACVTPRPIIVLPRFFVFIFYPFTRYDSATQGTRGAAATRSSFMLGNM